MNIVRTFGLAQRKELQVIGIPKGAKILSVCVRQEQIKVAIQVDPNEFLHDSSQKIEFAIFSEERAFKIDDYNFLGTIVLNFGNDIYHVFYRNVV